MRISNEESLFAPVDAVRPLGVGLRKAVRRAVAAEHLAAPPVARLRLRTAHNALKVSSTVPASDRVGIATVAPPPEPREATCECVETQKRRLNGTRHASGYRRCVAFRRDIVSNQSFTLGLVARLVR